MGTLTAGLPRMPHYCDHKLPTSCRLTSIGECCACYDERVHRAYYSTYIDGVGYVPRGNRWQRYCWFCKEFWEKRVNASGLRPAQTRIPEIPDQSAFLARWYEFHQGYRVVKREDGTEERVAVLGEDMRHVHPGLLPRTLEELRAGREQSQWDEQERTQRQQPQNAGHDQPGETGPSLDEALDQMFQATESEQNAAEERATVAMPSATSRPPASSNIHANVMTSMNSDQAALELEAAEQEARLRRLQNQQRTTEIYLSLFGTREGMMAQGGNYESPIGGMFTRPHESFRVAEELRREERTLRQLLEDAANRFDEVERRNRDTWGVPRSALPSERVQDQTLLTRYASSFTAEQLSTQSGPMDLGNGGDEEHEQRGITTDGPTDPHASAQTQDQGTLNARLRASQDHTERNLGLAAITLGDPRRAHANEPLVRTDGIIAGPPGEQLDEDPDANNDRGLDALFVLLMLASDDALRAEVALQPSVDLIQSLLTNVAGNSLTASDKLVIGELLLDNNVVWASGLPAERMRRRRYRGEHVTFTEDLGDNTAARIVTINDLEIMAESFQISGRVRRLSGLSQGGQNRMLARLNAGERNAADREVLARMIQITGVLGFAKAVHERRNGGHADDDASRERIASLEHQRRQAAREGDYSRTELDAQRRATRTSAIAAGRGAMRTEPRARPERMANRDEATRGAYDRRQENGFMATETMPTRRLRESVYRPLNLNNFTASPSATDTEGEEEEKALGLDAKDTGRPDDPLSDEQMTVNLSCRICYSQLSNVACLPCGHLVMCKWCSDQHSPTMPHDRTRPRRAASCPACRKQIRQKIRVFPC